MTDSAIRTEAQLLAAIEALRADVEAATIGRGIAELSALGFGYVSLTDYDTVKYDGLDGHWYSATRHTDTPDAHTTSIPTPNLPEHTCSVYGTGPTPSAAMAELLSEARTKAAPK